MRFVLLVLAAAAVAGCGRPSFPPSAESHLLGQPLPELRAHETLNGTPLEAGDFRDRVVVVKFFASYCEPCKRTLPAAERVHEAQADVMFLGVSLDESREDAVGVVKSYGLTFPVVYDAAHVFQGKFHVSELPRTFVADRKGVVRWVGAGGQTDDDLDRAIEAAR
jgi:thiol-disulfide isomerase/thioredoxin